MTTHPPETVERIVIEVLRLRESGEDVDLDELCGHDALLRSEVEVRLSMDARALGAFGTLLSDDPPLDGTIGEYELRALLGAGGMGRVYEAYQPSLEREVALKIFDSSRIPDERARTRFLREATIAASLSHPNIVPIHAVGEDEGRLYIAMKKLSGPGLDTLPGMAPREAAEVGLAIAQALDDAHTTGIIHRDVKPANIVMDGETPCLVDFGLARSTGDVRLTSHDAAPGTLAYMAPERLKGADAAIGPSSDLYSLAATLYELVAGQPPFDAACAEGLIHRVLFVDPPPLHLKGQDADLETLILRGLDKDPNRRFGSAAQMAEEFRRYLDGRPILSRRTGVVTRVWRKIRRHPRATATVIIAAGTVVAVVSWQLWTERRDAAAEADAIAAIEAALRDRDIETARAQLATLETLRGDAPELGERIEILAVLEELFDQILDRPAGWVAGRMTDLWNRVDGAPTIPAEWRRRVTLMRAVAIRATGDAEGASALIEPLTAGRDRDAVAALIDGSAIDVETIGDADDEVFVTMALRVLGTSYEDRLAHLDAIPEQERHFRLKAARALLLGEMNEHRASYELFRSLNGERPGRTMIVRNLVLTAAHMGRPDLAARHLEDLPEDASPGALEAHLVVKRRAADPTWQEQLARYEPRWKNDAVIALQRGDAAAFSGDLEAARRYFELARRRALPFSTRLRARLKLLPLDVSLARLPRPTLIGGPIPLSDEARQAVERLRDEARALAAVARGGSRVAQALFLQARLERLLTANTHEDLGEYERLLRRAAEVADGNNPMILIETCQYALQHVDDVIDHDVEPGGERADPRAVARRARPLIDGLRAAEAILDSPASGRTATLPGQLELARLTRAAVLYVLAPKEEALAAYRAWDATANRDGLPGHLKNLSEVLAVGLRPKRR